MIWYVNYKDECLFDIELYWDLTDDDNKLPELEVHVLPKVNGLVDYTMNVLKYASTKTVEKFKKDSHTITELRGWLWENFKWQYDRDKTTKYDTKMYNAVSEHIDNVLNSFKSNYTSIKIKRD